MYFFIESSNIYIHLLITLYISQNVCASAMGNFLLFTSCPLLPFEFPRAAATPDRTIGDRLKQDHLPVKLSFRTVLRMRLLYGSVCLDQTSSSYETVTDPPATYLHLTGSYAGFTEQALRTNGEATCPHQKVFV